MTFEKGFTPRMKEVFEAIGLGLAPKEVADILNLSPKTVQFHVKRICEFFNTDTDYLPRLAHLLNLAPVLSLLILMVGCKSQPSPPPVPPPIPKTTRLPSLPSPKATEAFVLAPVVTLVWNAPTSGTPAGYKLYQGIKSGTYTNIVDVGNVTQAVIVAIPNFTNFFAAKAYDAQGLLSDFSNEAYSPPTQKKTLAATIVTFIETSTNNLFSGWRTLTSYTNYYPILPDPSFFQTRLSISITNTP